MKNLTKLLMLGFLLIPFAALINLDNAYAGTAEVTIPPGTSTAGCEVESKCWDPSTIEVAVGTTVVWTNKDSAGHTVNSGNPGDADAGALFDSTKDPAGFLIKPETTWQHAFNEEGEFPYFCMVHPYMVGKVIVTEGPPNGDGRNGLMLVIPTDNGSTEVEVKIDKGMVEGDSFTIDPPQTVKFDITFLSPGARDPIPHVNYEFHVADESGNMVAHKTGLHVHEGMDTQSVTFASTGSFTLMIKVIGTGISQPYDTANSGTASSMIAVTPEFPVAAILPLVVAFAAIVAVMRIRSSKNLPSL